MGGSQSTMTRVTTEIRNEFLNRSEASCRAECNQSQTGNIIVIDGSAGDIVISQKCEAKSSCVIKNSLNLGVESVIDTLIDSDQDYQDALFSFTWNTQRSVAENTQILENKMTNIMSATCNSSVSQMQSDNIIYVRGTAGSVALTQEGNAKSNCTLDNIAKMTAYNDIANDIQQGQGRVTGFGAMMSAIGTLIIFGVIMFIMMIMFSGIVGVTSAATGSKGSSSGSLGSKPSNTGSKPSGVQMVEMATK